MIYDETVQVAPGQNGQQTPQTIQLLRYPAALISGHLGI